jgi:predicted Fe-S protein YdhL (DUF1289 family)
MQAQNIPSPCCGQCKMAKFMILPDNPDFKNNSGKVKIFKKSTQTQHYCSGCYRKSDEMHSNWNSFNDQKCQEIISHTLKRRITSIRLS